MNHETRVLFVAWQCPDPTNRAFYPVGRLLRLEGGQYEFAYVQGVESAIVHGFVPFFGPRTDRARISNDLPAFLSNRLMSPQRPDYPQHVRSLGLAEGAEPITVLARGEGAKVTDNLEVFAHPTFDAGANSWVYFAFCRGIRHVGSETVVATLRTGDPLLVVPEPTNVFDPDARLLLRVDAETLGYVPRTLIDDLSLAEQHGAECSARVERVNLAPAPVQQRLLVRISVLATHGFQPLSTPRYQPVAKDATRVTADDLTHCS